MLCKGYPKTYAMVMQVCQDACPLDEFFQQFKGRLPENFKKSIYPKIREMKKYNFTNFFFQYFTYKLLPEKGKSVFSKIREIDF